MKNLTRVIFIFLFFAFTFNVAKAETRLLMFEEHGCYWCEKWREEIGGIYDKSPEGKVAKLKTYYISDGIPKEYQLNTGIFYSPTFVLVDDKVEIGRIEGYPGSDFFWGLLEKLLGKLK